MDDDSSARVRGRRPRRRPWFACTLGTGVTGGYGYSYANNWIHGRETREPADSGRYVFVRQITDERRRYYELAGLLKVGLKGVPEHEWTSYGEELRRGGRQVVVRENVGLIGFYAGPEMHIIDSFAFSDPLSRDFRVAIPIHHRPPVTPIP